MSSIKLRRCLPMVAGLLIFAASLFSDTLTVLATDDIYGAGYATLPGTVYPGTFAPSDTFAAGANQTLTFSSVTGTVGCNFAITNGPDGTCFPGVNTAVTSYRSISGISAFKANMFLVGVFLNSSQPSGSAPPVLSYNFGTPGSLNTTDAGFSPLLNQVFFIGDGLTGTGGGQQQDFYVPTGASRLYLGFADNFDGPPDNYADNVGSFTATFSITSAPEPASLFLVIGGLLTGVGIYRRRSRVE
jgi:hypothetical protein